MAQDAIPIGLKAYIAVHHVHHWGVIVFAVARCLRFRCNDVNYEEQSFEGSWDAEKLQNHTAKLHAFVSQPSLSLFINLVAHSPKNMASNVAFKAMYMILGWSVPASTKLVDTDGINSLKLPGSLKVDVVNFIVKAIFRSGRHAVVNYVQYGRTSSDCWIFYL